MATKTKLKADEVYICRESFAGMEHAVARGARLRGEHPAVVAHPSYFIPAESFTEEDLAPLRPVPEEQNDELPGRVTLRVLPVPGMRTPARAPVVCGPRELWPGEQFEAEGRNARMLLDSGVVELVKKRG